MNQRESTAKIRSQAMFMFISAALLAYFGFLGSWAHQYNTTNPPALVMMVVVLKWTLRIGAIVFAGAGVLAAGGSTFGPILNCVAGLATAAVFIVVAIWEWTNPQGYFSGVQPILLVLFAAWNGYGSWMGIQEMRGLRPQGEVSSATSSSGGFPGK